MSSMSLISRWWLMLLITLHWIVLSFVQLFQSVSKYLRLHPNFAVKFILRQANMVARFLV
jgi:hypothetical protein